MNMFVLVPIVVVNGVYRTPAYISFRLGDQREVFCNWSMMDYGFLPYMLVLCKEPTAQDIAVLQSKTDVFIFPDNLDQNISDPNSIRPFFESINVPADWLTPSNTYRQLLRTLAGMFQFMLRYGTISGEAFLGGGITLDSRYRELSLQQQTWFSQTVLSFGYNPSIINQNSTFRQLLKLVGDAWEKPFYIGGFEF